MNLNISLYTTDLCLSGRYTSRTYIRYHGTVPFLDRLHQVPS